MLITVYVSGSFIVHLFLVNNDIYIFNQLQILTCTVFLLKTVKTISHCFLYIRNKRKYLFTSTSSNTGIIVTQLNSPRKSFSYKYLRKITKLLFFIYILNTLTKHY